MRRSLLHLADYTRGTILTAEGTRIAVLTCRVCGCAILVDPRDDFDAAVRHSAWHSRLADRHEDRDRAS